MIIVIYGEDTFSSRRKLTEIKSQFIKKHGPENVSSFDFEENAMDSLSNLNNYLKESSFFASSQMAVSYNLLSEGSKLSKKKFDQVYETINKITTDEYYWLVLWESLPTKKLNTNKLIKPFTDKKYKIIFSEHDTPNINTLARQGNTYTKNKGGNISDPLINKLAKESNGDSASFYSNLDILISYQGDKQDLKDEEINFLHSPTQDQNIFDLFDAINQRNRPKLFLLLKKHFYLNNKEPLQLLGLVVGQVRKLLTVRDLLVKEKTANEISKELKMNPFAVQKMIPFIRKFPTKDLHNIFNSLFLIDKRIKTGEISSQEMLDLVPLVF